MISLLDRLRRAPTDEERAEVGALATRIEAAAAALADAAPSAAAAAALTRARLESSRSLQPGPRRTAEAMADAARGRERFLVANARVVAAVSAEEPISVPALSVVNGLLLGREPSPFREAPAYLDGTPCPPPSEIAALLEPMTAAVAERAAADGPLFAAGLLYQWLVSVHPWTDANGRTARLAVDWLLGLHGLVPISFGDAFDSFVSVHVEHPWRTPGQAAIVVARGVLRTLDTITSRSQRRTS